MIFLNLMPMAPGREAKASMTRKGAGLCQNPANVLAQTLIAILADDFPTDRASGVRVVLVDPGNEPVALVEADKHMTSRST